MLTLIAQQTLPIGDIARQQGLSTAQTYSNANPAAGFGPFLSGVLSAVMVVAALLLLLYLLWGGIEWITSGGDKGKTEKARDKMTQAVIGIIVLAASVAIFTLVQSFLGINVLNFGGMAGVMGGSIVTSGGSSTTGGGSTTTVGGSGGCTVGQTLSDGGAGGYCTTGAATVKCFGPGQGVSKYSYNHFEPCSCNDGPSAEKSQYNFSSC